MAISKPPARYETLRQFGRRGPAHSYDRFLVRYEQSRLTAQVLILPQDRLRMAVQAHPDALAVDFTKHQVIDPDLHDYQARPGYYLHDRLRELRQGDTPAILFNGNNVGYWGNQYVIHKGRVKHKRRGPIFDDGELHAHVNGDHTFFLSAGNRFQVKSLALVARRRDNHETLEDINGECGSLPRFGLSGFPLLRGGRSIWQQYAEWAWDPGLLYDLGRIRDWDSAALRAVVHDLVKAEADMARHPMTVIGIDAFEQVVLMVVERSAVSRGMTVDEAADLLRRRFAVRDAIVLGAAGDAQLATTEEGFLTEPLVAPYAEHTAREIPDEFLSSGLRARGRPLRARPVPSYVVLSLSEPSAQAARQRHQPSELQTGMA